MNGGEGGRHSYSWRRWKKDKIKEGGRVDSAKLGGGWKCIMEGF